MGFSAMGSHIQDKKTLPELYHRLLFVVLIKKIIVEFKKNSISKPKKTMPSNIIYQNYRGRLLLYNSRIKLSKFIEDKHVSTRGYLPPD